MAGDNKKNSFRDMMLIIFVVLICFGITIYGIVYLTGKVFSGAGDISETSGERPVTAMTDPESGETLTFTPIGEPADEVKPVVSGSTVSENTDRRQRFRNLPKILSALLSRLLKLKRPLLLPHRLKKPRLRNLPIAFVKKRLKRLLRRLPPRLNCKSRSLPQHRLPLLKKTERSLFK